MAGRILGLAVAKRVIIGVLLAWLMLGAPAAARIMPIPVPSGARESILQGITCLRTDNCWAVGHYSTTTDDKDALHQVALAEHSSSSGITRYPVPRPPGAAGWTLQGVGCSSATSCWGVGSLTTPTGRQYLWVAHRSTGGWRTVAASMPAGAAVADLNRVSCHGSQSCLAVGEFSRTRGGDVEPLAVLLTTLSGHRPVTTFTAPLPAGAVEGALAAVSCVGSPVVCQTAGTWTDSLGMSHPLVESWTGGRFTVQSAPDRAGARQTELAGVSCLSAGNCLAGGFSGHAGPSQHVLAEHWNGSSWTLTHPLDPAGATWDTLFALSCVQATTRCFAFGAWESASVGGTLAERWNGTSWSIVASGGTPPTGTSRELDDGACLTIHLCVAAGNADAGGNSKGFLDILHPR